MADELVLAQRGRKTYHLPKLPGAISEGYMPGTQKAKCGTRSHNFVGMLRTEVEASRTLVPCVKCFPEDPTEYLLRIKEAAIAALNSRDTSDFETCMDELHRVVFPPMTQNLDNPDSPVTS